MKTLLIITGPQGSGNHLWSKVFAANQDVFGWKELNDTYWVAHDQEPFAEAWHDPALLNNITFDNHAVTSISCPYAYHGTTVEPDYEKFINAAKELGYNVKLAIIGRDQTVLEYQQTRVRGAVSLDRFRTRMRGLLRYDPIFLSTELLYLYNMDYIHSVQRQLDFPIHISQDKLDEILAQNPNTKYFTAADEQPLDGLVRKVSGFI